MLNKNNIVATQYSDHHLVEGFFDTYLGKMHICSLNLLIRKSLRLYQPALESVKVRLNFPFAWLLNTSFLDQINNQLLISGQGLKVATTVAFNAEKKQLELIDLVTNSPSMSLPSTRIFYFESEDDFYFRMYALGKLIGKIINESINKTELNFFCVQELQMDEKTFFSFLNGLISDGRKNLGCYHSDEYKPYSPAIIYDISQFELVNADNEKIESFKQSFSALIGASNSSAFIGQLVVGAFKHIDSSNIILIASYHADFLMINQACHKHDTLIKSIAKLALEYNIIITGDFNRKIQIITETNNDSDDCMVITQSTEPGLQLHDTLDAIFFPKIYPMPAFFHH